MSADSHHAVKLDELLALCLEAERLGVPVDHAALVERHPEHAAELAEFLAGHEELKRLSSPIREEAASRRPDAQGGGGGANEAPTPTSGSTGPSREIDDGCLRLGKYRLIRELGRGGMGVVYEAWQEGVNRPVAVKVISSGPFASAEELSRFRTEAEAAANLSHPGLVPIYEVDVCEGRPFYSMEYVPGQSLAELIEVGRVSGTKAASLIADVADAVEYAHRRGVIHRDLKPANVLVDSAGRPRVTDFGLAKWSAGDLSLGRESDGSPTVDPGAPTVPLGRSDGFVTKTGAVLGTPSFMAPEQARGQKAGPAVDVYGLGAILYTLLTGRPPFKGTTAVETLSLVAEGRLEPVRRLNADVPSDLATIIETCLEKEPQDRYRTAADVAADLRRYLAGEPIRAGGMSLWGRLTRAVGQSRHVSHFRQWGHTIMGFGVAIFIAHVVMQFLVWGGYQSWPALLGPRLVMFTAMLAMLRWSRTGSLLPRDAVERLVWVVWTAYLLAYGAASITNEVAGESHVAVFPFAATLAGMAFFTLGCHVWGACYLVGGAFFIAAPLLALAPEYAVIGFGALWGLSLGSLGLRYAWLNRVLPQEA